MKKQIFRSISLATIIVILASVVLIMGLLYDYFSSVQMKGLETETRIIASALELEANEEGGDIYLNKIAEEEYRITWVASDGSVIYDNKADAAKMGNHSKREEIKEAMESGFGKCTRYSDTLMKKQLYCAKRLSDGTVLRMSSTHLSLWAIILNMLKPIALVIGFAVLLSVFLAYRLAHRIVRPLNEIDLDKPQIDRTYDELSPLINRLNSQKEQLRLQENILRQKKEEFDAATENMQEGIVLLGENGDVLSINRAASDILQISSYCIGKDLLIFDNTAELAELLHTATAGEHAEQIIKIAKQEDGVDQAWQARKDNNASDGRNYQFNASPIVTDGKVSGVALIILDITEKEKAEAARREFTANVSHELRTPLQNISGSAELLASGIVKPEDVRGFAENIYVESKRLIDLISDIIKLSHLDEEPEDFVFEKTDLFELAKTTYKSLTAVAAKKQVKLDISGESSVIEGVPSLISEIIYNLSDNAIKYNRSGGRVEIKVENREDAAVLTVEDDGFGIPKEEQERIFERFYRVDKSRSKEVGGTGLGLSIVKHAALTHNAKIELASEMGKGSRFEIRFPKTHTGAESNSN